MRAMTASAGTGDSPVAYAGAFSIAALRAAYRDGVSPCTVIEAAYDRIERVRDNPIWINLVPRAQALARARELARFARESDTCPGPLFGIPFAVKDNIDAAGLPTTAACPAYEYRPGAGAPAVDRILAAGGILIGKTNLDQFATGLVGTRSPYGACRNAFDPRYVSGGSSSGSAVAVALELASFALGTDTAGSGRVPAAFNNIVGLKPTRGLVSTRGVVPACRTLDCVSVFALDCTDALEVLGTIEGYDSDDPYSRRAQTMPAFSATRPIVAVPRISQREFFGDAETGQLYEAAIERVIALGAQVREIDFAPFLEARKLLYEGPWVAERAAALGGFLTDRRDALHAVTRAVVDSASAFSAVDAFEAAYRLEGLRRSAERAWGDADCLLVPAAPTIYTIAEVEAEPIALNARLGLYTNFVNLLDLAAVSVPSGLRSDGLPFGVTLIGRAFSDRALATFGSRLHAALGIGAGALQRTRPVPLPALAPAGVPVAVVGAHLTGMPLNPRLVHHGATLARTARTAGAYRLYALPDPAPARPGLVRVGTGDRGAPIEVEVWNMPVAGFGALVAEIPSPLAIGTVELEDGATVKGFLCEPYATDGREEITAWGGWRRYLASRAGAAGA